MSSDTSFILDVDTPQGPGRFHCAPADPTTALLILGHGAGGGIEATDLSVLADRLPAQGLAVARFEQPWRVAGKKVAGPPPKLDMAWTAAVSQLLGNDAAGTGDLPVFFGGRSAGARVACRTAPDFGPGADTIPRGVAGVVCCAFPLHPPGRPDRSRAGELLGAGVPALVLQGERDSFGSPGEVAAAAGTEKAVRTVTVPGADHAMRTRKNAAITAAEVQDLISDTVTVFCL